MHPTTDEIRALFAAAKWTAYRAAKLAGVNPRSMQRAFSGETRMSPPVWRLLKILACQSERAKLPPAPIQ